MKRTRWLALLLFCLGSSAVAAPEVRIEGAWLRALPPSAPASAIYFRLSNEGRQPLIVQGASCEGAKKTMLHETVREGGMDRMRHAKAWQVPPHGVLVLEPGGKHLMAMGLHAAAGTHLRCKLQTNQGTIPFEAEVRR